MVNNINIMVVFTKPTDYMNKYHKNSAAFMRADGKIYVLDLSCDGSLEVLNQVRNLNTIHTAFINNQ